LDGSGRDVSCPVDPPFGCPAPFFFPPPLHVMNFLAYPNPDQARFFGLLPGTFFPRELLFPPPLFPLRKALSPPFAGPLSGGHSNGPTHGFGRPPPFFPRPLFFFDCLLFLPGHPPSLSREPPHIIEGLGMWDPLLSSLSAFFFPPPFPALPFFSFENCLA